MRSIKLIGTLTVGLAMFCLKKLYNTIRTYQSQRNRENLSVNFGVNYKKDENHYYNIKYTCLNINILIDLLCLENYSYNFFL